METAVNVLVGLALIVLVGAFGLGAVAWRNSKREDEGKAQALRTTTGGGGEPKEPA